MFHNCSPRPRNPMGLEYELPDTFDMTISRGSVPVITSHLDIPDQTPAQNHIVVSWSRALDVPKKVDVNFSPYEMGRRAARQGKALRKPPFTKKHQPEALAEFMDGLLNG